MGRNDWVRLLLVFGLALAIRTWHFPGNVYFGYDQARDAYQSIRIYKERDLKIIGPSTAMEGLFHGPLYWYLIGPLYLVGRGNPVVPAAGLLFLNATGVLIIYWLGKMLFGKNGGLIAAIIYAVSFEQSQYAMYFGNPALAVLAVMMFYGGLIMLFIKEDWRGLAVSLAGWGLAIQFEFFLIYLGVILLAAMAVGRKMIRLNWRQWAITSLVGLAPIASFIVAEAKYGLRTTKILVKFVIDGGPSDTPGKAVGIYLRRLLVLVNDNVFGFGLPMIAGGVLTGLTIGVGYWMVKQKKERRKIALLMAWVYSSAILVLFGVSDLYYVNIGVGAGLILMTSSVVGRFYEFSRVGAVAVLGVVMISNLWMIKEQNPKGIINDIYVQEGMLLTRELKAIDYIYQEGEGGAVVVAALTMPLKINTTWSYLFSWYGQSKYGRLPYWAGEVAGGYDNDLPCWESQEERVSYFNIIEPTRGVRGAFVENFLEEQDQYGEVVEEKVWGEKSYARIVVQKRKGT